MLRKIIVIDQKKCTGCGLCVTACHEGAIKLENGKAVLAREDFCDGLGDCLPACPVDAISFEEREALAYDEAAVMAAQQAEAPRGCPGTRVREIAHGCPGSQARAIAQEDVRESAPASAPQQSRLTNWPVQIKLAPPQAPYFAGADLLIAADCTAFSYGSFHEDFIKDRVTLIGCPKLDQEDYAEKLAAIIAKNDIRSVTLARMEVPCCGGLERAAQQALALSGKALPFRTVTFSLDGRIL